MAETLLGLCDRFHKLPAEIRAHDTDLLRLLAIEAAGHREEGEHGG